MHGWNSALQPFHTSQVSSSVVMTPPADRGNSTLLLDLTFD